MKYRLPSLTQKLLFQVAYVQYQSRLTSVQIKMAECDSINIKAMLQENSYIILKQMKVGCSISTDYVPYLSVLKNPKLILPNGVHKCFLKSKPDMGKNGEPWCFPEMLFTELSLSSPRSSSHLRGLKTFSSSAAKP